MNVFLDANVLVSILTKEHHTFVYTSLIVSQKPTQFRLITSSVCIAIAYYFTCKKFKKVEAKRILSILCKHLNICDSGAEEVAKTLLNRSINDVEDGIQYYSAIKAECTCIVTEDLNDYYFSEVEILSSQAFFDKYIIVQ